MKKTLLPFIMLFAFFGFSQTNFLQNSSFENWSNNPETPDNWTIENENSYGKASDGTDGSYSLELDLNNQISSFNQTLLSSKDVNVAQLQTSTTYTVSLDYKVQQGNTISSVLWVLRDAGSYTIQHSTTIYTSTKTVTGTHTHLILPLLPQMKII